MFFRLEFSVDSKNGINIWENWSKWVEIMETSKDSIDIYFCAIFAAFLPRERHAEKKMQEPQPA